MCSCVADTRETGFVNAITAAGVTYAVTRACTMGDLIECSCDKSTKGTEDGSVVQSCSFFFSGKFHRNSSRKIISRFVYTVMNLRISLKTAKFHDLFHVCQLLNVNFHIM